MKIYDVVSHRSYEIDPSSINLYATRKSASNSVWLHEGADKGKTSYCCGQILVSHKVWKKIVNTPRKSW